jgi:hypothetical protein
MVGGTAQIFKLAEFDEESVTPETKCATGMVSVNNLGPKSQNFFSQIL